MFLLFCFLDFGRTRQKVKEGVLAGAGGALACEGAGASQRGL